MFSTQITISNLRSGHNVKTWPKDTKRIIPYCNSYKLYSHLSYLHLAPQTSNTAAEIVQSTVNTAPTMKQDFISMWDKISSLRFQMEEFTYHLSLSLLLCSQWLAIFFNHQKPVIRLQFHLLRLPLNSIYEVKHNYVT